MERAMDEGFSVAHRLPSGEEQLPLQPNLTIAINLSDIGAVVEDNNVTLSGKGLSNVEQVIPSLAGSGVGRLYLYGGLYEMSEISKKVHNNPARNSERRIITSGKATILVGGYPTQHEMVEGVELSDRFGSPFSIYDMNRFNPYLTGKDEDTKERLSRTIDRAHISGMKVIVDFIPWFSSDAVNERNYKWMEYKELGDYANEVFRNIPEPEKEEWLGALLIRPENHDHFAVRITENGKERVVLVKHVVSLGTNVDQANPNTLNPDVQDYYIESLKRLIDIGVDEFRVDLASHLLIWNLPDEEQPFKHIVDATKDYARSKGREIAFVAETYSETDSRWLERLGADQTYSPWLFETYFKIARENLNAVDIKDAVWHALFARPQPLVYPSNYDETSLVSIGGGTKGFAMLLMAMGHLKNTPVMFDLRDWLLHTGHIIKIPGGDPDPRGKSRHLFVKDTELGLRRDFAHMKEAVERAPLKKVRQDFYKAVKTNGETYIDSPPSSRPDSLFPLCWRAENGDWTVLVVNLKPSGEDLRARVMLPEKALKELSGTGAVIEDVLGSDPAVLHKKVSDEIEVEFGSGEEYKIYHIRNPASGIKSSPVSTDVENGITDKLKLINHIIPGSLKEEMIAFIGVAVNPDIDMAKMNADARKRIVRMGITREERVAYAERFKDLWTDVWMRYERADMPRGRIVDGIISGTIRDAREGLAEMRWLLLTAFEPEITGLKTRQADIDTAVDNWAGTLDFTELERALFGFGAEPFIHKIGPAEGISGLLATKLKAARLGKEDESYKERGDYFNYVAWLIETSGVESPERRTLYRLIAEIGYRHENPDDRDDLLTSAMRSIEKRLSARLAACKRPPQVDPLYPSQMDLHMHSAGSDGTDSVLRMIYEAYERGLKTIAITDHQTFDGVQEAIEIGKLFGIRVIPAIELYTGVLAHDHVAQKRDILVYFPDVERFKKWQEEDIDIGSWKLFHEGRDERIDPRFWGNVHINRVVSWAREHGGIPVLAHPTRWSEERYARTKKPAGWSFKEFERFMIETGLGGVEVSHPEVDFESTKWYMAAIRLYNERHPGTPVIFTTATDSHKHHDIGRGNMDQRVMDLIASYLPGISKDPLDVFKHYNAVKAKPDGKYKIFTYKGFPGVEKDEYAEYIIRYNDDKLKTYERGAGLEAGTLKALLDAYKALVMSRPGQKCAIKLIPSSGTDDKNRPVISVEYYKGRSRTFVGKGQIDIDVKDVSGDAVLMLADMAQMAFAMAHIPIDLSEYDIDKYSPLISLIRSVYEEMTGVSILTEEILQKNRTITLPSMKPIPAEKLREYYELTIRQLEHAA
ncbi:MAG: PHP domain-containing protein [Candidatus Omnitrophota bacterium]